MPFQSLYRRYRPQRFDQLRGQDHVSLALRNAVRDGRVAHAYLFSGPRGTGKTSTARILAKALNCQAPHDGEPDDTCSSCHDIAAGSSLDVFELDAASNNGVDAMRDLVARAALGTPGRWKVYIVDEVHMLSTPASNALLKTLEEPPGHVVFVLATTDPQKVLPTIRSRTQHFEFHLVPPSVLTEHLRWVAEEAGLDLAGDAIEVAVRRGSGSVRDALSALDQIAVGGMVGEEVSSTEELMEAICERDVGRALAGVAERCGAGADPRHLTRDLLEHLRNVFLLLVAPNVVAVPEDQLDHLQDQARRLGPATAVRAMELLGESLVDMRDAPDPRILLEVVLVRLTRPEADTSMGALLQRMERMERALETGEHAPAVDHRSSVRPPPSPMLPRVPTAPAQPVPSAPPAPAPVPPTPPTVAAPPAATAGSGSAPFPSRDDLTLAWGDHVLAALPPGARALFRSGRFVGVEGETAVYGLPNPVHRDRCEKRQQEVEAALGSHFGRPVRVRLVVAAAEEPPVVERGGGAARVGVTSPVDHVMQAFEGAEVVEE